ncbi:MAG TPA: hypothetical protein VHA13_01150, partial [Gammaproteobacteria bacterium]|nr:hypothetical protein [Gammaproteobacteria bacterium]
EEKLYKYFKGNKAIHDETKAIIDTPAKLQIIKTLFFMAAEEKKVADMEAEATRIEMQQIMAEVTREEERLLLSEAGLHEEKAITSRSINNTLALNSNSATSPQQIDSASKSESQLQDMRQKSIVLIETISQVMSDKIYSVSRSEDPSQLAAKSSAKSFISCTQALLKMHARLLQIKGLARHLKEIVAGLGNFSKPTGLPQLQEFYSEARTSLYNMAELLEEYQAESAKITLQLDLNENWHKNLNDSTVKADSLVKLITDEALPALENFNNSLRPGSMAKDLTKVISAFQGVNVRLELLGRQFQISPVYNVVKQTAAAALLADKHHQEVLKRVGNSYNYINNSLMPSSKPKLLTTGTSSSQSLKIEDITDLDELGIEDLQNSKIRGHGSITISDVLDKGQLEESVDSFKLHIPNHAPILLTEAAFKWIQAKQASRKTMDAEWNKQDTSGNNNSIGGSDGAGSKAKKTANFEKSGLNSGIGESGNNHDTSDLELIDTLNKRIAALKQHNETLRVTAPRFNRHKDFPLNVFSGSTFKFWMFLPFIPVHVLILMPIAGIYYLANRKSIKADLKEYERQKTQFDVNLQEIAATEQQIHHTQTRIKTESENRSTEKSGLNSKIDPSTSKKANPFIEETDVGTEEESKSNNQTPRSSRSSSLSQAGFFPNPIKLTVVQISAYAQALCSSIAPNFKEAVQKQYLAYQRADEEASAKQKAPDYSRFQWKDKASWKEYCKVTFEASYEQDPALKGLKISQEDKNAILKQAFFDVVRSAPVASNSLNQ